MYTIEKHDETWVIRRKIKLAAILENGGGKTCR